MARDWEARRGSRPVSAPHEWRHISEPAHRPGYYPRPESERQMVRHKTFAPAKVTTDEAAFDLDLLDYDFYLFTDADSGQDCVIYRTGPTGYRLAQLDPDPARTFVTAVPLTVSERPAPVLTVAEARKQLDATGLPFQRPGTGSLSQVRRPLRARSSGGVMAAGRGNRSTHDRSFTLGVVLEQREVGLLLLGKVQGADCVQPVQHLAQPCDVALVRAAGADFVQEPSKLVDQVADLYMGPRHGDSCLRVAKDPVQDRVQLCAFGELVRLQFVDQAAMELVQAFYGVRLRSGGQHVGRSPELVQDRAQRRMLGAEPAQQAGVLIGDSDSVRPFSYRPERIGDHGDIDGFLQDRAQRRH
jgi:hypothetical protein